MDIKRTLEKLKGEANRKTHSLYLSDDLFQEFKRICGDVPPSRVLEELMRQFIEQAEPLPKKRPKKK